MITLGKIKIVDTFYDVIFWRDFKALQEHAKARDLRYLHEKEKWEPLDGYCDYSAKELHVFRDEFTSEKYFNMTLTHEITHAFLYEIGFTHHDDEDLIDKISKWLPRLEEIVNQGKGLIENARTKEE